MPAMQRGEAVGYERLRAMLRGSPECNYFAFEALLAWSRIHHRRPPIKVEMTKREFMAWAVPRLRMWMEHHPDYVPAFHRRDIREPYRLTNLLITSGPRKVLPKSVSRKSSV